MKNIFYTMLMLLISIGVITAQNIPNGMNYQAIARDGDGSPIANQEFITKVEMLVKGETEVVVYSEEHLSQSNQFGLLNLTLGAGDILQGEFTDVPWSDQNVWVRVSIMKESDEDFNIVTTSQLYSVPYAYYATEAGSLSKEAYQLKGKDDQEPKPHKGNHWDIEGNIEAENNSSAPPLLGNADYSPIVFITDDKERMRITEDGDITIANALNLNGTTTIDADLIVKQNVYLNVDGGTTEIDGPTTIGGSAMNPTRFTGPVQMDKTLDVDGDTKLSSNLTVGGATDLGSTLDVSGSTQINNTLTVEGNSTLNSDLTVAGNTLLESSLNVTDDTELGGTLDVALTTHLRDALRVDGTVDLNAGLNVNNQMGTHLSGALSVDGVTQMNNRLFLESSESGVAYGFGDTVSDDGYVAIFKNTDNGNGDGLKIMLGKSRTSYSLDVNNLPAEVRATVLGTTSAASEQMKNLIKCGVPNKLGILQDVVIQGGLDDAKLALGAAIGLTNGLIGILNQELGLPFNVSAPLNAGLQGLANLTTDGFNFAVENAVDFPINSINGLFNPIDFTAPLNTALSPFRTLNLSVPAVTVFGGFNATIAGVGVNIPRLDTPIIPIPEVTILPTLPSVKLPTIPGIDVPDIAIDVPDLPNLIVPAIPSLDFSSLGIPTIDILSLSFWEIPDICLTESGSSTPLNNENEFLTFTDKDNNKMGSIKAVSVTDWSKKYLNPMFLSGLRAAITESKVDKMHGKYHLKQELNKALLAYANIGVEYRSGNGDYAEWLERMDHNETITPGDIIAVIGGKVTKDLGAAEQVMVVSHHPIVLGNMPAEEDMHLGNNIAFMGQVPVKILGPVKTGDYIVGQDNTPGYGIAIDPQDMQVDDFKKVVGRSWENNESEGVIMANTVIGVHNGNFLKILKQYEERFNESETKISSLEEVVDVLYEKTALNN